uniref:Uncharacterized protein n=1 Tax=Arundo donax TaxID=35708 RepID=A0A0A9DQV7_ARUDO
MGKGKERIRARQTEGGRGWRGGFCLRPRRIPGAHFNAGDFHLLPATRRRRSRGGGGLASLVCLMPEIFTPEE